MAKRKDLTKFAQWLEDERGMIDSSVNTYVSYVRRILRGAGNDLTDVAALVRSFHEIPRSSRNGARAAWKAFTAFLAAQGHPAPPVMPRTQRDGERIIAEAEASAKVEAARVTLPNDVLAGLCEIAQRQEHALAFLAQLRWQHVTETPVQMSGVDGLFVEHPASRKEAGVIVDRTLLERLRAWGRPNTPAHPLIPLASGSAEPWPSGELQRLIQRALTGQ